MPSNRYKDKRAVCVSMPGTTARYGWLTNVSNADGAALGHQELDEDGNGGEGVVFFGASRPKPPRAQKVSDGVSSFYDPTLGGGTLALPEGWVKIAPSRGYPIPSTTSKSNLVYVEIDGAAKYGWKIPQETFPNIGGDAAALGIKVASNTDKVFLGVNRITNTSIGKLGKPPRASKQKVGTDGVDTISSWSEFPTQLPLPAGWSVRQQLG